MHSSEVEELICMLSATIFFLVVKMEKDEKFFNLAKIKSHELFFLFTLPTKTCKLTFVIVVLNFRFILILIKGKRPNFLYSQLKCV